VIPGPAIGGRDVGIADSSGDSGAEQSAGTFPLFEKKETLAGREVVYAEMPLGRLLSSNRDLAQRRVQCDHIPAAVEQRLRMRGAIVAIVRY
jgi:hypothetical protein